MEPKGRSFNVSETIGYCGFYLGSVWLLGLKISKKMPKGKLFLSQDFNICHHKKKSMSNFGLWCGATSKYINPYNRVLHNFQLKSFLNTFSYDHSPAKAGMKAKWNLTLQGGKDA